jgi:hypothetical protein
MLDSFPRLPFSLDPLMAEAKRRARQRRTLIGFGVVLLVGLAVGLTLAYQSPGGGPPGGAASGKLSSGANNPQGEGWSLGVTTGMTAKEVLAKLGRPLRVVRTNPRNPDCWAYPRGDINGKRPWWFSHVKVVAVCLKHGRVDYVGP